eukprot:gene575-99_t
MTDATRHKLFGGVVPNKNPMSDLTAQLQNCFSRWDCREIRSPQFVFEVERTIGKPVEPEVEKYIQECDNGMRPFNFKDFMGKLFQGRNTLANLAEPKARTDDSAAAIIHDNSGAAVPRDVSGKPVMGKTDLNQDSFIRAELAFQGRARQTNNTSFNNPLLPSHKGVDESVDSEVIIRMFLSQDLKESEFRKLIAARNIELSDEAERLIRRFVSAGEGTFRDFRKHIR